MRHRLLVVEDDAAARSSIAGYLAGRGYDVDSAAEPNQAISLISSRPYSAVITDLQLTAAQETEGLAIVVEVRHRCPSTRIIVLTGAGGGMVAEAARLLGADLFLQKPKSLQALEQEVRTLVEARP